MNQNASKRIFFWDNFKGILIFLVVFAHWFINVNQGVICTIVDAIYMFHMPAFVFISGYFGKSAHSRSFESILRLLAAYILFNGLSSIFFGRYSFLTPFAIYWYIIALIVWRLSAVWLAKLKYCLPILTIIAILIGYSNEINNTLAFSRIVSFAPYYMAGYLLPCGVAQNVMIKKSTRIVMVGLVAITLAIFIGTISYNTIGFVRGDLLMRPYQSPTIGGLRRICLVIVSVLSIYSFGVIIPNRKIPLLSHFGRHSISIYLFHVVYLYLNRYININNELLLLMFGCVVSMATCVIFSLPLFTRLTSELLSAGARVLKGNSDSNRYTLVVRTIFCAIALIFLLHQPILLIF